MRSAHQLGFVAFLFAACAPDQNLNLELPAPTGEERMAVVVVDDESGRRAYAIDLSDETVRLQLEIDPTGVVHVMYFSDTNLGFGELSEATVETCRPVVLEGALRTFRRTSHVDGSVEPIDEAPQSVTSWAAEGICPCVSFERTELPVAQRVVFDAVKFDEDHAVYVSPGGLFKVAARSGVVERLVPSAGLMSVFVFGGGQIFVGDVAGRLLTVTATGGLQNVVSTGDRTTLRYLAGVTESPMELLMMHKSGFVRRWDGTTLTELVDDSRVATSSTLGTVVSFSRGRALFVQGQGSGLHHWDVNESPSIRFVNWDTLLAGPISTVDRFDEFGYRLSTRARLTFESSDGVAWQRITNDRPLPSGVGVDRFARFGDGILEVGRLGVVQLLASDKKYCDHVDFQTFLYTRRTVSFDDGVLLLGEVLEGHDPFLTWLSPK